VASTLQPRVASGPYVRSSAERRHERALKTSRDRRLRGYPKPEVPRPTTLRRVDLDPELIDEDTSLRDNLAQLGMPALRELKMVLDAPQTYRDAVAKALFARPAAAHLARLLAMADTDRIVMLRLRRALRDLGV
jgi:hypothetical protein